MTHPFNTIDYDATQYEDEEDFYDYVCNIYLPSNFSQSKITKAAEKLQKQAIDLGLGYHTVYQLTEAAQTTLQFEFEIPVAPIFLAALEAGGAGMKITEANFNRRHSATPE